MDVLLNDKFLMLVALLVMAMALVFNYLRRNEAPKPSVLDKMLGLDSEQRLLVLTFLGLVVGLTATIYLVLALISKTIDPGMAAMVGALCGTILTATLTNPWGYWFGSSKGSADKAATLAKNSES